MTDHEPDRALPPWAKIILAMLAESEHGKENERSTNEQDETCTNQDTAGDPHEHHDQQPRPTR